MMRAKNSFSYIGSEGPEKATRDREGGELESIKIPRGNLAYVPNLTWRASLLAQPIPHSYRRAIGPQNWVRQMETQQKH
jgi:hypothetical protein